MHRLHLLSRPLSIIERCLMKMYIFLAWLGLSSLILIQAVGLCPTYIKPVNVEYFPFRITSYKYWVRKTV